MPEQNPNPAPRRRRKPRRPKWVKNKLTYTLWRNWPLIRFVLLCLLLLTILIGLGKCAVSAIGGLFKDDGPGESTPPVSGPADTTPPETTVPPETEPPADELMRRADAMASARRMSSSAGGSVSGGTVVSGGVVSAGPETGGVLSPGPSSLKRPPMALTAHLPRPMRMVSSSRHSRTNRISGQFRQRV